MFNSELFELSEKAFKSTNFKKLQKRKREMEKAVLEIIKQNYYRIDENGIVKIEEIYTEKTGHKHDYDTLKSIIKLGMQKFFEEEYSLYFIGEAHDKSADDVYHTITFIWDSVEYNIKNVSEATRRRITSK